MSKRFNILTLLILPAIVFAFIVKKGKTSDSKKNKYKTEFSQSAVDGTDQDDESQSKRKYRKRALSEVTFSIPETNNIRNFDFKPYLIKRCFNVYAENLVPIRFKRGPPSC